MHKFESMFKFKSKFTRKAVILSALVAILAVIYILTFALGSENRRDSAFAWLDQSLQDMADRIEISGEEGRIVLNRVNNVWFCPSETAPDGTSPGPARMLPVKQEKVGDLLVFLGRKGVYPVRASSPEAIERLGLDEGEASRIIVRGGAGLPLLDLFISYGSALGREIYLRRAGWNRIYSTEEDFYSFTEAKPVSWYDLRLFPPSDEESGGNLGRAAIGIDRVQQVEISVSDREPFVFRRSLQGWVVPNSGTALDATKVEAWLRFIIEAQADDFGFYPPELIEGSITFRLGDGTSRALMVGPVENNIIDGQKYRSAAVLGSSLVYLLSDSTFNNFFELSFAYLNDSL